MLGHLLAKLADRIQTAQAHRRRQQAAAAKLRALSVLPTRPGRLLHL